MLVSRFKPRLDHFLRAIAECFTHLSHRLGICLSVHPSVCLSVTLVICIKMVQAKIAKSSASMSLVFCETILCPWVRGSIPLERGRQRGIPPKKTLFCSYWLLHCVSKITGPLLRFEITLTNCA